MIEAKDLDEAIGWAAKIPGAKVGVGFITRGLAGLGSGVRVGYGV